MAFRKSEPLKFTATTLSDAVDSTNAPAGAMSSLVNLIPDSATRGVWVPRPAAVPALDFVGGGFASPGFMSSLLVVGNIGYGTVATARHPGHDEPFCYDFAAGVFHTVAGITAANTPVSPPATGPWTPPIVAQVGSRVVVTHPGFPGGAIKFGWFDISGTNATIVGDTIAGQPFIYGNTSVLALQPGLNIAGSGLPGGSGVTGILPLPPALSGPLACQFTATSTGTTTLTATSGIFLSGGYNIGLTILGPGIQPGTTVVSATDDPFKVLVLSLPTTTSGSGTFVVHGSPCTNFASNQAFTGTATSGSYTVATPDTTTFFVGQIISSLDARSTGDIGLGAVIISKTATSITLNQLASVSGTVYFNVVGTVINLTANATTTADEVSYTVTGGTKTAPLWGAGDTDINPLFSVPVGVAQMGGRAYFACGADGVPWSDSGFACRRSDTLAVQALLTSDGLPVTAIAPLQLTSLLGGIVQALIAFEGTAKMQQITGDQALGNLSMNALPVATGTLAPLSICSTEKGTAFVSPEGLRIIDFSANISDPIGDAGSGVALPFINSAQPTRICAAASANVLRISNQNGLAVGLPQEEYWFHLSRAVWSGPHTCAASLIQSWRSSFVMSFVSSPDERVYQSDVNLVPGRSYVERGAQLSWICGTGLLPDSGTGSMVEVKEMSLACQLAPGTYATIVAVDDRGVQLDLTTIAGDASGSIWGTFLWGAALWGGLAGAFLQRAIDWYLPLVFRQGLFIITGQSAANVRIGNLYMLYQILGYRKENP